MNFPPCINSTSSNASGCDKWLSAWQWGGKDKHWRSPAIAVEISEWGARVPCLSNPVSTWILSKRCSPADRELRLKHSDASNYYMSDWTTANGMSDAIDETSDLDIEFAGWWELYRHRELKKSVLDTIVGSQDTEGPCEYVCDRDAGVVRSRCLVKTAY